MPPQHLKIVRETGVYYEYLESLKEKQRQAPDRCSKIDLVIYVDDKTGSDAGDSNLGAREDAILLLQNMAPVLLSQRTSEEHAETKSWLKALCLSWEKGKVE